MGPVETLYERLRIGPAILFLGQGYLRIESGRDVFLAEACKKYGGTTDDGYEGLLWKDEPRDISLPWLIDRAKRIPTPPWLEVVASFAWSHLYVSAIDPCWAFAFRNDWRQLAPIYDESQRPQDIRSKHNLHCTLLYGSLSWADTYPPPTDDFALRRRSQASVSLLRRLPEITTPRGVLLIEGLLADDWLSVEQLALALDELSSEQVHLFNAATDVLNHRDIRRLIKRGVVVVHERSLATVLDEGGQSGLLRLGPPDILTSSDFNIELQGRALQVPRDLWYKLLGFGTALDSTVLIKPKPQAPTTRYWSFRDFLANSEGMPDWNGFARGFAFSRPFETVLLDRTRQALQEKQLQEKPIIIHGATGTGKTVALAHLAFKICLERQYPVVYVPRRLQPPNVADLETFVHWAEESGAPAVLVAWDHMSATQDCLDLLRYLTSRGRKVALVATSYRLPNHKGITPIEAPSTLGDGEFEGIRRFLDSIESSLGSKLMTHLPSRDDFFVALYRLLPPSRAQLREGVTREAGIKQALITRREADVGSRAGRQKSLVWQALEKAGLLDGMSLTETCTDPDGEKRTVLQSLTCLVMVPGQFGLNVPVELLLRSAGYGDAEKFVKLIADTDIYRWHEDTSGNIEVGPRNPIEAQILTESSLGSPMGEIQFVCRLIDNLVSDGTMGFGAREVSFIANLLQALDREDRKGRYREFFVDVVARLKEARTSRGVLSPQLMLQEGHLIREWAIHSTNASADHEKKLEHLKDGCSVLQEAIRITGEERRSQALRVNLLTELASTQATSAIHIQKHMTNRQQALSLFRSAVETVREARKSGPDTYHPVDVLAWSTMDLIENGLLTGVDRTEALADLLSTFETADPSTFRALNEELFNKKQIRLARLLERPDIEEEALQTLKEKGSAAGVILMAHQKLGDPSPHKWTKEAVLEAFDYVRNQMDWGGADVRLQEINFDLWWFSKAGEPMFSRERVALPFSSSDWLECERLASSLLRTGESRRSIHLLFILGLAQFHLGEVVEAMNRFREVERESDNLRSLWKVIRSYVASVPSGQPRKFRGIVASVFDHGLRGEVSVEELFQKVLCRAQDFDRQGLERNQPLPEFHIAFSLQGPIADPVSAYASARAREGRRK